MKTMKYGFINNSEFNKGIKGVNKDSNYEHIKENLHSVTIRSKKLLSNNYKFYD